MKVKAVGKYLRIGPRKVRVILDLIKNKSADQATQILGNMPQKGAKLLLGVLKSGIANAEIKKMDVSKLVVTKVFADGGPSFKRVMPRAMGRADVIHKRTTHISIELADDVEVKTRQKAKTGS